MKNPYPLWGLEWFAWKEQNENWTPYHLKCRKMPRVHLVRPGMYRCPACHVEFPTFTALCWDGK